MCGIAGFYGFRNDNLIKEISKELEHRGPDGEGCFINENVTLLSRRLAIIDVAGGDQPIYNEDKSMVIVFVGEIYNYQSIRQELAKLGHTYYTKSDTEVIIHAYEQWGEKSFDRLNGMFTFALYDKKKNKLVLVRDHFGIKPLYYSFFDNKLIFSSEIIPILYSGLVKKKPNDKTIYRYLKYRVHDDSKETFFEGIYRLMPGEMIVMENEKMIVKSYTKLQQELQDLAASSSNKSLTENNVLRFKQELINSVKMRLISEVPVGTCLSGGLDSSTVVAITNKLLKAKVKEAESVGKIQNTFSAVFPGSNNDEELYIDTLVHKVHQVQSHKAYPKPEDFFAEMSDFVRTQEEPTVSTGPYAQYKVMQIAHKKVTVVLDGQGADEMMAGYLPYYFVYLRQLMNDRQYLKLVNETFNSRDVVFKYLINRITEIFGFKKTIKAENLLDNRFVRTYENEKFMTSHDNLKKRLLEDIFTNSLQSLLRYEDRNAMHFSIEGRVPFLDFNLLRYLFALPDEAIIKKGWNKYILRQSVKDLLPENIRNRRNKIGFTTPEYEWFTRMKNRIYTIFLSESFANRKYFNQAEVLKAFQLFIEGKNDDTMLFWRLLNLELWLREFIDPKGNGAGKKSAFIKLKLGPNEGKNLEINISGRNYTRIPIKTDVVKKDDDVSRIISNSLFQLNIKREKKFFIVVSEKIVAIAQGRSKFIWDIKPGFWAKLLPKYVTKTPAGIGLGSPFTMQMAIEEIGLPRILFASTVAMITKHIGIKGMFYRLVSPEVASIDGPTEYSLYPSNVSAKLGPKNPREVAEQIASHIKNPNLLGVVIIDANDLGQKVLGNSTDLDDHLIEEIFKDNPMGQADEQTPICLVFTS